MKVQMLIFAAITILAVILFTPPWKLSGEAKEKEGTSGTAALEHALHKMEGVGEVAIYLHPEAGEKEQSPLADYFTKKPASDQSGTTGVLVVAEGAGNPGVKSELKRLLSAVLMLPEHRIVIVEMTKRGNDDENQ
ncbi:hypothetical protein NCCP2716_06100 [Sporosarcina sp. NCCP-2716]|nr:hypothetical protein NCCP2716_06100 [Sporosarcina sp. NCCP-2716]